ncbi:MAG: hypothetical protein JXQ90_07505 [Cyclobacteriaceae bacterium]
MLFQEKTLAGIKEGEISLAFRVWKKPDVIKGTLIHTSIGLVQITSIEPTELSLIMEFEAFDAGFQSLPELIAMLSSIKEGTIYKIGVKYHSPDPRDELRIKTAISEEEFIEIKRVLDKLDQSGNDGPWTEDVLTLIKKYPERAAADIASDMNKPKDWLKQQVRKLKNMGLTESKAVGYTLSPRGLVVFTHLFLSK